jgi:hypothetical protein
MLAVKLSISCCTTIMNGKAMKPLSWWKEHAVRFPKLSFLAQQILRTLGLQIKIDFFFSIGKLLTSLQHCRLETFKLDAFVMIYKNYLANEREVRLFPSTTIAKINKLQRKNFWMNIRTSWTRLVTWKKISKIGLDRAY